MGCGQSKIGNLYPKNKKNKGSSKRNGFSMRTSSIEHKNENSSSIKGNKTNNNGIDVNRNEDPNSAFDKSFSKKKPAVPGGGPLLQQTEVSSSQLDFFRMLDEKIENGPDYDESSECPNHIERVSGFLRRWELASSTEETPSNISSYRHTSHRHHSHNHHHHHHHNHHHHDLHPQSQSRAIPVGSSLSHRVVNRLDGLEDIQHRPSPNMPRHVLESISQSPTQSVLKGSLTSALLNQISDNDDNAYSRESSVQYHGTRNPNIVIAGQQLQQQSLQFTAAAGTNINSKKKGSNAAQNMT